MRTLERAGWVLGTSVAFWSAEADAAPVACGEVLTVSTALDNDLVGCPGDGLVIGAENITVTFNGHSISGVGAPGSVGIRNVGYDGVTIEDGDDVGLDIGGFETGILLEGVEGNTVSDLFIQDPFSGLFGIRIVNGRRNTVVANDVRGGGPGDCTTVTGGAIGLFDSDHNMIRNNQAHLADFGIALVDSDNNQILQNEAAPESSDGNECVGITLVDSNRNWVVGNVAAHSDRGGIVVDAGSRRNRILANVATGNAEDGIHVDDPTTAIAENDATLNFDYGIEAVAGVHDFGGNTAADNDNPAQCLNVVCAP